MAFHEGLVGLFGGPDGAQIQRHGEDAIEPLRPRLAMGSSIGQEEANIFISLLSSTTERSGSCAFDQRVSCAKDSE